MFFVTRYQVALTLFIVAPLFLACEDIGSDGRLFARLSHTEDVTAVDLTGFGIELQGALPDPTDILELDPGTEVPLYWNTTYQGNEKKFFATVTLANSLRAEEIGLIPRNNFVDVPIIGTEEAGASDDRNIRIVISENVLYLGELGDPIDATLINP